MLGGNWSDSTISNMSCKDRTAYFVDFFYVLPRTAAEVYRDIQHPDLGENQIKKPDPREFLGGLYFLKKYPSKKAQAGFIGSSEKYGLPKAWKYVEALQALKEKKIRWIFDEEPYRNFQEYYFLTVDGVHFRVYEPRYMPSSGWYSQKFNKAALAYEIGLSVYHPNICWVNGPFPAGQNDMRIFKKPEGLMSKIPDNQRGIGDEGYVGEPTKLSTQNEFDSSEVKQLKRRAKARQETINAKLKSFGILNQVFRTTGKQRFAKHKAALEACLVLIQYELDNGTRKIMKV